MDVLMMKLFEDLADCMGHKCKGELSLRRLALTTKKSIVAHSIGIEPIEFKKRLKI